VLGLNIWIVYENKVFHLTRSLQKKKEGFIWPFCNEKFQFYKKNV